MSKAIEMIKNILRPFKKNVLIFLYRGNNKYCPVCKKNSRKFLDFGHPTRSGARCVHCNSLERHRLAWLFFENQTDLFDGHQKNMLHVAPEEAFLRPFSKKLGKGYITADLYNPVAMVKMDITDIQHPDESFDVIYCSHVLEHVPDDRKAIREFYRVLKSEGWAVLLVPILNGPTHEDLSITDPQERLRVYGQEDHVRKYGTDGIYLNRLKEAGFVVKVMRPSEFLNSRQIANMGITDAAQDIYYCTKQ